MHTVAVISQKGGAGKTTLAVHLAVAAHLAGQRAAVIDLDPQARPANGSISAKPRSLRLSVTMPSVCRTSWMLRGRMGQTF